MLFLIIFAEQFKVTNVAISSQFVYIDIHASLNHILLVILNHKSRNMLCFSLPITLITFLITRRIECNVCDFKSLIKSGFKKHQSCKVKHEEIAMIVTLKCLQKVVWRNINNQNIATFVTLKVVWRIIKLWHSFLQQCLHFIFRTLKC